MVVLLIKVLLVPLLLAAVTWANARLGPRIAGVFAGLPLVAGPAALAVALEQGPAFAEQAAPGTLLGEFCVGVFCVVYTRACLRHSWWVSLFFGWGGFMGCALLLAWLKLGFAASLVLALTTPLVIQLLTPAPDAPPRPRSVTGVELGLRMLAGALLVTMLASAAHALGTTWSGLLTIFPIATSVLAASSQRSVGSAQTVHLLRGLGAGLFSLTAFFAVLGMGLGASGLAVAFGVATAAALLTQLAVLLVLSLHTARAERRRPHPTRA